MRDFTNNTSFRRTHHQLKFRFQAAVAPTSCKLTKQRIVHKWGVGMEFEEGKKCGKASSLLGTKVFDKLSKQKKSGTVSAPWGKMR